MKKNPQNIFSYCLSQWPALCIVTITGLIYNIGLLVTPWFEGQFTQTLLYILQDHQSAYHMYRLVLYYLILIGIVQFCRFLKRLYVRIFCNETNRTMKSVLYENLIHFSTARMEQENTGDLMTKAMSDVDDCAEGMRKFITEIFDTGVALLAYCGFLLHYDYQLALLCMIFPPLSYYFAENMKYIVQKTSKQFKQASERLNTITLDRIENAMLYRNFGIEEIQNLNYQKELHDYQTKSIHASLLQNTLPPLYQIISLCSIVFILYFGSKNILINQWDIAAFTAFLACYIKLSVKSSKAAKLFNHVHKASVSWHRIQPLLKAPETVSEEVSQPITDITLDHVSFAYTGKTILHDLSLQLHRGEIIAVTGQIASGKSTFGKLFLNESPYQGSILINHMQLSQISPSVLYQQIGYLGHDTELMNDTIQNNICMGSTSDIASLLQCVCFTTDLASMPEGLHTFIGKEGIRLSGGQAQRIALARTLAQKKSVYILDDPFSALDPVTEMQIFHNLQAFTKDCIVILISHRLSVFPLCSKVLWLENGKGTLSDHVTLLQTNPEYAQLYHAQKGSL